MRTSLKLAAALAAVWGGGCLPRDNPASPPPPLFSAEELAKFMGTREERAARAPYSPPGWPLRVGDTIPPDRYKALKRQFPGYYCSGAHVTTAFWVGDMAFGASFRVIHEDNVVIVGTLPGNPHVLYAEVPGGGEVVRHPKFGHYVYKGHFRRYIEPYQVSLCDAPPPSHLREHGFGVLVVPKSEMHPAGTWTRERWLEGYVGGDR